ncbi:MAG TPA: alpha/beta fold hydrolase [Gemmataceae bacterium]|nr:alpha/beta fold hydrolase [Gemmataceae bacterium]
MDEDLADYRVENFATSDGYYCGYRHYSVPPEVAGPRARVVLIHGIRSHTGWYAYTCSYLSRAGFDVFFLDRRGCGMNSHAPGDAPSFRRLLDDLAEFLHLLRAQGADLPTFLVAISWGGKLAAALQRRHPGLVDGLALLCPGFFPRVAPSLKQRLAILWARLVAPRRLFPIPLNDPELFTAAPDWQRFIRAEPFGLRQATARFLVESVRLDGYLRVVPPHVRVPVLLLLAEHDRIIDNAPTRRFVERFATADRTVIEYPGAHHTLEFEPDPDLHLRDLVRWLEARSGSGDTSPKR